MGGIRKFKKGEKGENLKFMTRNEAIKKLQVSLKVFRKLCILKGIHPRDPKKKLKGKNKTYYYAKDIRYLQHEKIIDVIRSRKTYKDKEKKLISRKQFGTLKKLKENRPMITLDHIIKERYPTFQDAIKDLDDCLCLIHLFASMDSSPKIRENHIITCQSLAREFQYYVIKSKSLRKVFVTVKGVYYQAEILGETVTWLSPINYLNKKEKEVDYGVMISFLEFYQALLKFVNYRLFTSIGLAYPPKVDQSKLGKDEGLMSVFNDKSTTKKSNAATKKKLAAAASDPNVKTLEAKISKIASKQTTTDDDQEEEQEEENKLELNASGVSKDFEDLIDKNNTDELSSIPSIIDQSTLFVGYHFFLSREVPRHMLEFIINSFGGRVSVAGGSVAESDQSITHQIVDRGESKKLYHTREYAQPQWVFDSVNSKLLLPITEYAPGVIPPPHLSPFVEYDEDTYIPARKAALDALINQKGFDKLKPKMDDDDQDMADEDDEEDQDKMDQDNKESEDDEDDEDDDENEDDLEHIESRYMEELREEKDRKRKLNQDEDSEDDEEQEEEEDDEEEEEEDEEEEEQTVVEKNLSKKERDQANKQKQLEEETKLAELMIRKKDKWIYNKVKETNQQKKDAIKNLEEKRARVEQGKDVNGNTICRV